MAKVTAIAQAVHSHPRTGREATGVATSAPLRVRFGVFEADISAAELRKQGVRLRLELKPFRILELLVTRPGQLVTRRELHESLWPDIHVGFDHSLNGAMAKLREALGDSSRSPRFVETLSRRGYRFIAPVERLSHLAPDPAQASGLIESIAVLPLENSTGNPDLEYLADGITETLIDRLSALPHLRVIARSSVLRYKCRGVEASLAGGELGVGAILTGRLLERAGALVLAAELVDVIRGWRLWGGTYTFQASGLLGVEEEVARNICEKLRPRLLGGRETARLARGQHTHPEAHEEYLKGRYFLLKLTEDGLNRSVACFQQATRKDPSCAPAFAGLADAYVLFAFFGMRPSCQVLPLAKDAALRCLALDQELAEGHLAAASVSKLYEWKWDAAERHYRRCLELNPNHAAAHRGYASFLAALGRPEESRQAMREAQALDPLSLLLRVELAWNLYIAGEFATSLAEARAALEIEPRFPAAWFGLGLPLEQLGEFDEAIRAFEKARAGSDGNPAPLAALCRALALAGRRRKAQQALQELKRLAGKRYVSRCHLAIAHTALGQQARALAALRRAVEEKDVWMIWVGQDPRFRPLREDPSFHALLSRVGFPVMAPAPLAQASDGHGAEHL